MKKPITFISLLLLCFVLFLLWYRMPKEYTKTYEVDGYQIEESFHKKSSVYTFNITKEQEAFTVTQDHKYTTKRVLINQITKEEEGEETCYSLKSSIGAIAPVCKNKEEWISAHLTSDAMKEHFEFVEPETFQKSYHQIEMSYDNNKTFYIWNYKGFTILNRDRNEEINIFSKDIYNINISVKIGDYIVIADYEQEYNFNTMYLINLKKNKVEKWELDCDISFDSYILGAYDKSIYLVDRKNKIEYELVPHKKKMRKVGTESKNGTIYLNGWQEISLTKLVNEDMSFVNSTYQYKIENEKLYQTNAFHEGKIRVSDQKVKWIAASDNETVYYLVGDVLYMYHPIMGEQKLMQYFEWNFNYNHMIFIDEPK